MTFGNDDFIFWEGGQLCIDVKNKVCYINVASYLPMTIHDIKFNEKQEQGVRTTFEMLSEKQTFDRLLKDLMTP